MATLVLGDFSLTRMVGMLLLGGTLYAVEVPLAFRWIDGRVSGEAGFIASLRRTAMAIIYFNPLWIARHLLFIRLFTGDFQGISWQLLVLSGWSFLGNLPASAIANHLIQNKLALRWRYVGSCVYSAITVIYFAFAEVLF